MSSRIPKEELLDDLGRANEEVEGSISAERYQDVGEYSPSTIINRFGSWNEAKEQAGLDTKEAAFERGQMHFLCYSCNQTFAKKPKETGRIWCPHCQSQINQWRAKILYMGENCSDAERLASGPITSSERGSSFNDWIRQSIGRFSPPSPNRDGTQGKRTVYYLNGDERRAASRFIEENYVYVSECLEYENNPLATNWPDWKYELLVEQWCWLGYAF